jgi:AsmA protein
MDLGKNPIYGRFKLTGLQLHKKIDADVFADLDMSVLQTIYPIHGLSLKGKMDFELQAKGKYVYLNDKIKEIPAFHLNMEVTKGKVKYDSLPSSVDNIKFHRVSYNPSGKIEETSVLINDIHLDMGKNPVSGYVSLKGYKSYMIDAAMNADMDLADLQKIYPIPGTSLKGIFDLDIKTKGIYDHDKKKFPAIDAKMHLKDGWLKTSGYPEPVEHINLLAVAVNNTGNYKDTQLNISDLTYTMKEEPFEVKGKITDLDNYTFDLKINGRVNLEKITKIYPLQGMSLKGIIDTDFSTKGKVSDIDSNAYRRIKSEGHIRVKDFELKSQTLPPLSVKEANFSFTPEKMILEKLEGKAGKSIVSMKGELMNYMVVGEIRFKDGIMSLKETGFNSLDARFMLTGDYDTRDINHPIVDFNIDIKELDINRAYKELGIIRELAPAAGNAEGSFSISYKLKGELDPQFKIKMETMVGGGEVRIANAKINGMKIFEEISRSAKRGGIKDPHLKDFVMNTEIRNNKIFIKPFSLKISGFETDIEGVSEMSGAMQYIFKIELLPIEKLKIPFHVTGTYDDPKVALGKGHTLPD